MRAKLKLTKGSNAGKTFEISVPQFVIGRAAGCNLRPQSDAISRQHCAILLHGDHVAVRDLKSRNGTFLNGDRLTTEQNLSTGDELQVGPLMFEVIVTQDDGTVCQANIPDVVERHVEGLPSESGLISEWLLAQDEAAHDRKTVPETRHFQIDATSSVPTMQSEAGDTQDPKKAAKGKKGKPEFGKLPKPPDEKGGSSRDAAADTLRKMFNRGHLIAGHCQEAWSCGAALPSWTASPYNSLGVRFSHLCPIRIIRTIRNL